MWSVQRPYSSTKTDDVDQPLLDNDDDDERRSTSTRDGAEDWRRLRVWAAVSLGLWLATLGALVFVLVRQRRSGPPAWGTYETGWLQTELHSAFPVVELEQVRFQQYSIPEVTDGFVPPPSDYTGEPTAEMDAAWEALIAPNVIMLSKEEMGVYAVSTLQNGTGYYTGLQVYHNLHCLNSLRRAVYQHVYGAPDKRLLLHLDHCIDLLREANQCHMDMTPMLFFVQPDSTREGRTFALRRHMHTCRKFDALHRWASARTICGGHTGECQLTEGKMVSDGMAAATEMDQGGGVVRSE